MSAMDDSAAQCKAGVGWCQEDPVVGKKAKVELRRDTQPVKVKLRAVEVPIISCDNPSLFLFFFFFFFRLLLLLHL